MSKRMYADFSDEAYEAFKSGEAVDNNGFRSKKGNFYPDQPTFSPMHDRQERLKDAGVDIIIAALAYAAFEVVLPEAKRFAHEKVYPFAAEKWDTWRENCQQRKAEKQMQKQLKEQAVTQSESVTKISAETDTQQESVKIIRLDEYRKMA